jgi:hypothetical protein
LRATATGRRSIRDAARAAEDPKVYDEWLVSERHTMKYEEPKLLLLGRDGRSL